MSELFIEGNAWALDLPNGWQYYILSDLISFYVDNRGKTAPTADFGIPLIATNCIKNENLYPTYDKVRYVSNETYQNWFRAHPKPNDIIIVNKGTPGLTNLVPDPVDFVIAQDMMAIRANTNIVTPFYLFAALRSPHFLAQVNALTVGTTIPHLKKTDFDKLIIPVPPLEEQEFLGEFYYSFCSKIEANRRMNETLEAIARALFKSWFVDFDPVHAKARGEAPAGMDSETAALFPDGFEESELGLIPSGWGVGTLDQMIDIIGGGTPKTSVPEYWDGDIPWFSVKDVPSESDVFVVQTEKQITQAGVDNSSAKVLPELTTIISARGTVGKLALTGVEMAMNQSCYAIRGKDDYPDFFTYFQLKTRIAELQQQTHGTVFDTITRNTFSSLLTVFPDLEVAKIYDYVVEPLLEQIRNNVFESRTLAETRDALLPKLVSGEVRVGEVG